LRPRERHASRKLPPSPYISHTISTLPRLASGLNHSPTFSAPRLCLMANPHQLPPGNTAFGKLSAASSPLPMSLATQAVDYPHAFTAEQLASARASLRLNPRDFPDFSQDTLSGLIPSQTATLTLLSQLVRGLVTISQELSGVTKKLTSLAEENDPLKDELHALSSPIANLLLAQTAPPNLYLPVLQSVIRDLSDRLTAPAPSLPQPPAPTPQPQPPAGPPRTRKGKENARAPPSPPPNPSEDPIYLIPYYDTKLGRAFGDPKRYAQLFPNSYEAGEFRKGAYDLTSFTPGHLHPDYTPSPWYAQAASGSSSGSKAKKASKPPSSQQVANLAAPPVKNGLPFLPGAQRRFFSPLISPAPHPDTTAIGATFPDIAARVLRESNCLLPLGFSASVNIRGAISLRVTDKATPAASYAPDFEYLTRFLNQSFPVGDTSGAQFLLAPIAVQLAIHALPLRVLPQDEEELFPYLRQAILNDKATPILRARYLNLSRDSRGTKQATSVVVTVDPPQVAALTSTVVILSQKGKVELAFSASHSSEGKNCWRYGHATQQCPTTHPTCPIRALHHTGAAHRGQNPTCPRSGNKKPVTSSCPTSPRHCCNCSNDHTATFQ